MRTHAHTLCNPRNPICDDVAMPLPAACRPSFSCSSSIFCVYAGLLCATIRLASLPYVHDGVRIIRTRAPHTHDAITSNVDATRPCPDAYAICPAAPLLPLSSYSNFILKSTLRPFALASLLYTRCTMYVCTRAAHTRHTR